VNNVKSTRQYEHWLGTHTQLVMPDLELKHRRMAEGAFPFLRATFYRWMQVWPQVCPELTRAPRVLGVGDLHVENFGTWRDIEGRLVWGVNDFDEAAELPFTNDLARLATSAILAIRAGHLSVKTKDVCEVVLDGYRESLSRQGRPFVLEEENTWLRQIALGELRDPVLFWNKMDKLPRMKEKIPASARDALEYLLPQPGLDYRVVRRIAGLGSLGRVRLVAIAECNGGRVAREAKALVPSSFHWTHSGRGASELMYQTVIHRAVRSSDPFVQVRGRWIVRRLSPHCCRIELNVLPQDRDELKLLFAMGWETANIHLSSRSVLKPIRKYLDRVKATWLSSAARDMATAVTKDWRAWKKSM
jgi:hypothetical protein